MIWDEIEVFNWILDRSLYHCNSSIKPMIGRRASRATELSDKRRGDSNPPRLLRHFRRCIRRTEIYNGWCDMWVARVGQVAGLGPRSSKLEKERLHPWLVK